MDSPLSASSTDLSFPFISTKFDHIKAKLVAGQYVLRLSEQSSSKVWEIFGFILDENAIEFQNIVACKNCYSVFTLYSKSTLNLTKHKCYKDMRDSYDSSPDCNVDFNTREEAARVVTAWTIENCRSTETIEDNGLKKFAELMISIGARYGDNIDVETLLPQRTTISKNLNNLYKISSEKIKLELKDVNNMGFALTSKICTDRDLKESYLAITMHYIKENTLFNKVIGLKAMEYEYCGCLQVEDKVLESLMDFNCYLRNAITVTDYGKNMMAAFRPYDHVFCFKHLLDNVIDKSITYAPELNKLYYRCVKLFKYFKKSGVYSELISKNGFSPPRWNHLVSLFEKNWMDTNKILRTQRQIHRINGINIKLMTAICTVLKFFEETSKELEGDTYPTLHLVIPHVYRLKRLCVASTEDCKTTKLWKDNLIILLDTTVVNKINIFHKIALFLYPPTNTLIKFSTEEKRLIKDKCMNIMRSYAIKTFTNPSIGISKKEPNDLFGEFVNNAKDININEKINLEIQLYENCTAVQSSDFNVLQWWYLNRSHYPLLYLLSCKIFATPASCASSEKVLLQVRKLITDKRNRMNTNSAEINKILFTHFNMDSYELHNLID